VLSDASFQSDEGYRNMLASDWFSENFSVYALLKPNTNAQTVAQQMSKLVHDNFKAPAGTSFSYTLQPLADLHLYSENIVDGARNSNVDAIAKGNPLYIKIFSFIAFFLLLIAGINYINLTTAKASARLKEIGVRKTIGALKSNLFKQFLFESLLVTFISFLLAIVFVNLLLPCI
jgi:putative ABC transport system permease protein